MLTYHGSHTPHVGAGTPFRAKDYLGRPVLSRLDIVCEMVVDPARVAQVCNLDADDVEAEFLSLALLASRGCC